MQKAYASYTYQGRSIIVNLDASNGAFRSFRLYAGKLESKASMYEQAYTECSLWAKARDLQLEVFRAG